MVATRLEVRLDPARQRRLAAVSAARGAPVSDTVRYLIDQAYEETMQRERISAARRIGQLEREEVPDPATLRRHPSEAHGAESTRASFHGAPLGRIALIR